MKTYRIPCTCSAAAVVGAGQAGGTVECPACGATLAVPRLRDLEPFALAAAVTPATRPRRGRPLLLLGLVILAGSMATAFAAQRYAVAVAERLPDEPTIRFGVGQADAKTIYEVWKMMRRAGVDRGPLPDELRAQQTAMSTERIARFLWVAAAAGGVIAAIGGTLGVLAGPGRADAPKGMTRGA